MAKQLTFLSVFTKASGVTRFHSNHVLRTQNIMEHSAGVAMIVAELYRRQQLPISPALLKAALHHDLPEIVTGDIPAPMKRALKDKAELDNLEDTFLADYNLTNRKELSEDEQVTLKFADNLEGMLYCCREIILGNYAIGEVFKNYVEYQKSLPASIARHTMFLEVCEYWDEILDARNGE